MRRPLSILIPAALGGALVAGTICWIAFGVMTPGDFFANGFPYVNEVAGLAALAGALVAIRIRSRAPTIILGLMVIACLLFWGRARDGWWAKRPPDRHLISLP
jgi:hypothetical protein